MYKQKGLEEWGVSEGKKKFLYRDFPADNCKK